MPVIMLMRVLFPLPDGPTMATNSPPWICRSTPRSAVNGPALVLKTFSTFSSLTSASFISYLSLSWSLIPENIRHRPAGCTQGGPQAGEAGNHDHANQADHQGDRFIFEL